MFEIKLLLKQIKRLAYMRFTNSSAGFETTKLVQDMAVAISLRFEDEISVDSLIEDIRKSADYPNDIRRVINGLRYLQHAGLIKIDWCKRIIKRQKTMKEYVVTYVIGEPWSRITEDWRKISSLIKTKYKRTNPEYEKLSISEQ